MLKATEFFSHCQMRSGGQNNLNGEISRKQKMRIELDFLNAATSSFNT